MTSKHRKDKLEKSLRLVKEKRIWKSNYAPPLYRLLWSFGIIIPPPHFNTFSGNALFNGLYFGAVFALIIYILLGFTGQPKLSNLLISSIFGIVSGLIFGCVMGGIYKGYKKYYNFPDWKDI